MSKIFWKSSLELLNTITVKQFCKHSAFCLEILFNNVGKLSNSAFASKKLKEMDLPKNIRVGAFLRDGKIIIPNSESVFEVNDDVVFFSETACIKKLEKLLSVSSEYS